MSQICTDIVKKKKQQKKTFAALFTDRQYTVSPDKTASQHPMQQAVTED